MAERGGSSASKPRHFAWSWAADGSTKEHVICIFCGKDCKGGGISRLKHHLSCIPGGGIDACPSVPGEVKKKCIAWRMELDQSKSTKTKKTEVTFEKYKQGASPNTRVLLDGSSEASHSIEENEGTRSPRRQQAFEQNFNNVSGESIFESYTTSGSQPSLAGMGPWTRDLHEGARNLIADWFFSCAIPHNAAAHPLYQKCFDAAIAAGKGFRAPTRKQLAGVQLDRCVADIDGLVRSHRTYWSMYGCTIMADGWTTSRGRTLINFLVSSYKGLLFLRSVDASHKVKRADYLADLFEEVIQEVGPSHVVQVVTDNAANFVKAGDLIMRRHPTVYWSPCAAHCLDLLLEDIGKLPRFAEVIKKAKLVGKFIYNHTIILNLMRTHTKGKDLVRLASTCFATHFLTLQSMEGLRLPLMQAFGSDEWQISEDFHHYRSMADGVFVSELVYDLSFWARVSEAVKVVEPLIHVLRIVDGDSSPMPKLYEAMDVAKEAIASFFDHDESRYKEIWGLIDERWNRNLHRPLHAAAHHLNPRFVFAKDGEPYIPDNEVKIGFYDTMERLVPDLDAQEVLIDQLRKFSRGEGIMFSKPLARRQSQRMTAARWWEEFGADTPELCAFAMRILTQPCSAPGCERNWSAFEHIYAKRRTRLTMDRLDKLVYCYYNMKLRFRTEDPMEKEDMQLDTLVAMVDDETRIAGVLEWLSSDDDPPAGRSEPDMSMADPQRLSFTTAEGVTLDMSIDDADAISRAIAEDERVQMLSRLRKRTRGDGSGPSNV